MIGHAEVEAAAARIAVHVRRPPLVAATALRQSPMAAPLFLKLECLQPTGSFKDRGAMNRLLTTPPQTLANGIVTASGGNHGLAVARAASVARVCATVFVSETTAPYKIAKLEAWGASVRRVQGQWDIARDQALAFADERGATFFHPFADPMIVAGQGTIGLELLEDLPDVDVVLVAIGGGGLISGLAIALRAFRPQVRIIGVEPTGSPTLRACLDAGRLVRLDMVTSRVATMACAQTDERIFDLVRRMVDDVVLVSDDDLLAAARWLWFELGIAADLSGAAGVAALRAGGLSIRADQKVCTLVCGAGTDGL
ncbi:MAG: pyridoxal-phosphate dependent enzyme [Pseudomonadota bacterium]|nr:pyridoxal-phosphate dependent enzyme [Pseudomonadota bacterium]